MRIKLSDTIISLPQQVDISEDHICPACGSHFDGLICNSCSYECPPDELDAPNTDPQGNKGDDYGAEVPNPNENPQYGEQMPRSRYNDLVSAERSRKATYDQTSTINLNSEIGPGEKAPSPVDDAPFSSEDVRSKADASHLFDLDQKDVTGGPGNPAVKVPSTTKPASRRVARKLLAQIDDLVDEARNEVGGVKDGIDSLEDDSANAETTGGLGALSDQLDDLQETLEELEQVASVPTEVPGSPEEVGPPVDEEVAREASRLVRKVARSRRTIRKALKVLADDSFSDDEADDQVNDLIDELTDQVEEIQNTVALLDGDQAEDNELDDELAGAEDGAPESPEAAEESAPEEGPEQEEPEEIKEALHEAYKKVRSSRKRIAKVSYLIKFAEDEDEKADDEVDSELEKVDSELKDAEETAKEAEGEQDKDKKESSRKQRRLFRRSNRVTAPSARIAEALRLVNAAYEKLADEADESAQDDLRIAEKLLAQAEKALYRSDFSRMAADESDDDDDDDSDDDDEKKDDDEDSKKESARKRRHFDRSATNGTQETHKFVNLFDLDTPSQTIEDVRKPDKRINVTDPTQEGDQTELANIGTPQVNNGRDLYNDQNPPSLEVWPNDPGGYEYKRKSSSKEKLFKAIQLTEEMVRLGMVQESDKANHIANLESMNDEKLAGFEMALGAARTAVKVARTPQRVAAKRSETPSLGRSVPLSSTNNPLDDLFLL